MSIVGEVTYLAGIDTTQIKKDAAVVESTVAKAASSIKDSSNKAALSWKSGMDKFDTASQIGIGAILAFVGVIGKNFVDSASNLQSLRASFESLTGTVEGATEVMSQMYQFGLKTAFKNEEIQAAARSFLAVGVETDQLSTYMKQAGDIAGATGANLGQFTLPLTQAIARGKLQTQDFYQILNSGAGAFRKNLEEEVTKRGLGNFQDALSEGTVTTEVLNAALASATKEGGFAFNGAIKQADTFKGRMSNLQEAITNVGLKILGVDAITGQVNPGGMFDNMSNAIKNTTNFLTENKAAVETLLGVITILLAPAIIRLGIQALVMGAQMVSAWLLALGPIGLIIAAVGAVAFLVIRNWETVKAWFTSFWSWMSTAASSAWNKVKTTFTGIGTAIGDAVGGAFKYVINAVLTYVESKVNGLINILNNAIDAIDKITPGKLSRLSKISIPKLATGGIVSSPTLAMIGEGREPEAVVPLSQLDKMMNGTGERTITNTFSGPIYLQDKSAVDEFFGRLSRNQELARKGLATI